MASNKKVVAIVMARSGSKGIPKKNLSLLRGKPLIQHAIESGLGCPEIDRIIVSTDSSEIADVAKRCGAEVPFMRPAEISQSDSTDKSVFVHLINWLRENEKYEFDILVVLRCTTPFKRPGHISKAIQILVDGDCDSVRTATRIQGKYHPYWMFGADENGYLRQFIEGIDMSKYHQRQLLPPAYSVNGLVDAIWVGTILGNDYPYGKRIRFMETDPLISMDIDTRNDLIICNAIMEKFNELV